jgi:arylsulfatase
MNQPNILLIFPDQLRADFLGCYGAEFAKTPNIDKLCGESLQYRDAISPAPICIAARASMLTGMNCIKTGVFTNDEWLRPDHSECGMPTWPELLSANGYHTEGIGKMHFYPWDIKEGFDHRVIAEDKRHLDIEDDYQLYLKRHGLSKYHGKENPGYHEHKGAACSRIPFEHQVDIWTADRTVEFLDGYESDQPFACMVGFPGPHCPYDPPEEIAALFDPEDMPESIPENELSEHFKETFVNGAKACWNTVDYSEFTEAQRKRVKAYYSALIHQVDIGVGRIVDALERNGQLENTVIMLASDHGDFVGDYGFVAKSYFLKPAMNVPMLVRLPGGEHQSIDATVCLTDLFRTILGLADVPCRESGDSVLLPGMPGNGPTERDYLFAPSHRGYMVIKGKWKYVRYYDGFRMLVDREADPEDRVNRYADPECREVLDELREIMEREIDASIKAANREKVVERGGVMGEGAFGEPGWQRTYPAGAG